jgi:hypothetical protein
VGSAGVPWLGAINTGVPDWGILKLWDGALTFTSGNTAPEVYPYYWRAPLSKTGTGTDIATDPVFNVVNGLYSGGGPGEAHAGFTTVSMGGGAADGFPSWRIIPGTTSEVIVSGIVSPADRGVLALVKWDAGFMTPPVAVASVADIQNVCVAAVLLGKGIVTGVGGCDGTVGGIFTVGSPTPYDFPGQAAGQYDLDEIHTGISRTFGPPPAADPTAGQVRLLTDPTAVSFSPGTVAGGMPILGATAAATGGGTASNFFAYRLPYLSDYATLSYTPLLPDDETTRYFVGIPPAGALGKAGNYDDFTTDYWAIQLARYRHRFVLAVGAPGALRRDGSYALVHFRKEQYFEEYVRDGIVPTAAKLYSVNMVSWSGAAQIDNLIDLTLPAPATSPAYPVNVSEVSEDPTGTAVPAMVGPNNTFTFTAADVTWVSGISYYKPLNAVTGLQTARITGLDLSITNVFNSSYRTHDAVPSAGPLFGDDRGDALNQCPVFISLSPFSYEGTESPEVGGIDIGIFASPQLFLGSLGKVKRQRIEFGFADLFGGLTNPAVASAATVLWVGGGAFDWIGFTGDTATPAFSENAKVRVFVRRPLNTDITTGYPLPALPATGLTAVEAGGARILFHSMFEHTGFTKPNYGNPTNVVNYIQNTTKDREELFLDEIYRYPVTWEPLATTIPADAAQLIGPGLPGGLAAVSVPVRPILGDPDYLGYYFGAYQLLALTGVPAVATEAQVAGLPERNPPYTDGLDAPFPSRGICIYPKDNYAAGGYTPAGADYSACAGERYFVRAFDAGAANVGEQSVILKFWGVSLADFAYVGPTPGGVGLALLAKVPGLTTWMDVGRTDGAGPSKQDVAVDGAGCLVLGPNTFDITDPSSQIQCAQVEVNLGALAPLFLNGENKCPVLVQVRLRDNATAKDLDWQNVVATAATATCHGLVGIEIIP